MMTVRRGLIPMSHSSIEDFVPVDQFVEQYPHIFPTRQSFNHQWFNRDKNGLEEYKVVRKVGNRILINKENVIRWLLEHQ